MKERLDVLLVSKGFFDSREKAKRAIMAGLVFIGQERYDKAGTMVPEDADIHVKGDTCPYVSRGGLKLEKSIKTWDLDLEGDVCMDIGSSTGGFTDCMLQNGATKVYALDVGTNQLAYSLRVDPRVVVMEKTNIRDLDTDSFEKLDFISIDVSFISLNLVLPVASRLLKEGGQMVALVKPQFEAGREKVGKGGIVRDKSVHREVVENVVKYAENADLRPCGLSYSPITGAKGNIEYLLYMKKTSDEDVLLKEADIRNIVESSHSELDK
ncbi:MAG: TlyA family RNA methyltransferase [Firmicutes bacterium]|nr:TlyA family RNA methyltransferase [Bacillota bacterium]MBR3375321.1 TlyA family RNA methyltransferase [Bacillota bacterium]MBR4024426.1 TlyA family RNA methyltransferase [Bacillota bacterium]